MNNDVFFAFVATFYPNLIYSKPITDPLIHTVMLQYPIFILIRCIVPHTVYDITAVTCQIFFLLNSASNMFTVCNTYYVWKKMTNSQNKIKENKSIDPKDKRMKRLYFNFWNILLRQIALKWTKQKWTKYKRTKHQMTECKRQKNTFGHKNESICHFWCSYFSW